MPKAAIRSPQLFAFCRHERELLRLCGPSLGDYVVERGKPVSHAGMRRIFRFGKLRLPPTRLFCKKAVPFGQAGVHRLRLGEQLLELGIGRS